MQHQIQWVNKIVDNMLPVAIALGGKLLGAIVALIVGRWIIHGVQNMLRRVGERRGLDATLIRYLYSALGVVLQIVLVVAILGIFGIETTTFAGLLAAAGVAIGMAWSGLLANFAAGVFLVVLRPFKVGDMITVAGVTGVVHEIGLFVTTLDTADNIRTFVGNNKIFSDNIQNYSANSFRRVELTAQLAGDTDVHQAMARLKARLATLPNVVAAPAPEVEILTFTMAGPVLAVRPYCHNLHYWGVYFAANLAIKEELASYSTPSELHSIRKIG